MITVPMIVNILALAAFAADQQLPGVPWVRASRGRYRHYACGTPLQAGSSSTIILTM
jgi:hypothetical protein